ncbi:MAG: trypsin-like peptidase domain-containing protein [Chloracidobacterium sp.]|nr:trypsin-like peptidase domain-containing protein [Chloracidobacterium sp.]
MFSNAYEVASAFTQPLVVGIRFFDGSVEGGLGSFVVLNDEGWIMTAAHNLSLPFAQEQHAKEIAAFNAENDRINADASIDSGLRNDLLSKLKPNPKWVTNVTIMFGAGQPKIENYAIFGNHDIAFLQIDRKELSGLTTYPKIKDPADLKFGMSVCKLGFPFYPINITFDEKKQMFDVPPNLFPIPRFPIEGIYTRNLVTGHSDGLDIMWMETSSPGLKGQSGGPIFDSEGNICAIQSQNVTIPLGFVGEVEINGSKVHENQFMNVGIGVHAATITSLLAKSGIKFDLASP